MSDGEYVADTWIQWLCSARGNHFLCEVDQSYIEDAFNLYGLRGIIPHFRDCLDMVLDCGSDSDPEPAEWSGRLYKHARDLYGLIHARFILTGKGMAHMAAKYHERQFGVCPRVYCHKQPVLPVGLSDDLGISSVKLFCPSCQDVFRTMDTHVTPFDGAYFGTTFPHLFLMMKPQAAPRSAPKRYVPKIYGFKIFHPSHLKNSAAITAAANGDRPATGSREVGAGAGAGAAPETAAAGGAAAAAAVAAAAAAAEDPAAGDEDDLASTKKRKSRQ